MRLCNSHGSNRRAQILHDNDLAQILHHNDLAQINQAGVRLGTGSLLKMRFSFVFLLLCEVVLAQFFVSDNEPTRTVDDEHRYLLIA